MLSLPAKEAHFWSCRPENLPTDDSCYLGQLDAVLDANEQQRRDRFKFERHALMFRVSHALVRYVLSQYAHLQPSEWRFRKNEHGKPYVVNEGFEHLQFSLSHTEGYAAIAVSSDCEIGCDVERRRDNVRAPDIAHRFFSKSEVAQLLSNNEELQHFRFFDYWSLKESYIKAKGKGLAIPLGDFSFHLDSRPITFTALPSLELDTSQWYFELFDVGNEHAAAIAAPQQLLRIKTFSAVPLRSFTEKSLTFR
ncbi:MAG: 4'-phosphopantetheinyl transferase superfamily protein [Pseudomonadales bacterium]